VEKITVRQVEKVLENLNMLAVGDSQPVYDLIGSYQAYRAYGSWQLHKVTAPNAAVRDVLGQGFMTTREMYYATAAYYAGCKSKMPEDY